MAKSKKSAIKEEKQEHKAESKINLNDSKKSKFRTISKDKYVIAGILTLLIFSLGLTLGIVLEEQRYNKADEINQEQQANYISLQLQYLMLSTFQSQENCPVLFTTLKTTIDDLSGSLSQIIDYEKDNSLNSDDYLLISRRYTLDNLRYWLLANEAKESCDLDIVTVLYFYSDDCPSCPNQGTILTYFKKLLGDSFLVFPINIDLRDDEPMVEVMMSLYNVTKYPTLIIANEKYEGVIKTEDLQEIICIDMEHSEICNPEGEDVENTETNAEGRVKVIN
ncbi:MAG: hypothetical protein KJ896_05495 [Nanoarchaeota archaeon]|nr:hypothetical protein [Nanoarchaeota archaeon]